MKPVVLQYESAGVSPAYDVMPFFPLYILQCCSYNFTCRFTELPPFIPNEYLFKTHGAPGKEQWEVYADAVRDIMLEVGGLRKDNSSQMDKIKYEVILGYKKDRELKKTQ